MADNLPSAVFGLHEAVAQALQGAVTGFTSTVISDRETAAAQAALCVVHEYAPGAPLILKREAAIRLAGWLLGSKPNATRSKLATPDGSNLELDFAMAATGNGLRASGASALLARYVVRRAAPIGAPATVAAVAPEHDEAPEAPVTPVFMDRIRCGWSEDKTVTDAELSAGDTGLHIVVPPGGPGFIVCWLEDDADGQRLIRDALFREDGSPIPTAFDPGEPYRYDGIDGTAFVTGVAVSHFIAGTTLELRLRA